jgi:hypothetical protein
MAFVLNVVIGAVWKTPPVNVVWEMLILLGAAIAFSIGILRSEAKRNSEEEKASK